MSKQETVEEEQKKMDKQITVVGYLGETDQELRDFANSMTNLNLHKETDYTNEEYFLVVDDVEMGVDEERYKKLAGKDLEGVDVRMEEEEKSYHEHDPKKVAKSEWSEFFSRYDDDALPDDWEIRYSRKVKDGSDSDRGTVFFVHASFEETDMLVHPSEMEPENVVDDTAPEQPAMKFKMNYRDMSEGEIEWVDQNILEPFIDWLATRDEVERVRWTDCERKTKEEFVCFNI
jgi:hypothetical protein